jgi:uncharacterized protein
MPNFILTAYDAPNSLDKRLATRDAHFEYMKKLSEAGKVILGGAMLDESGNMIGSTIFFSMTHQEMEDYKAKEPYIEAGVWADVKIQEAKVGEFFLTNIANRYNKQETV